VDISSTDFVVELITGSPFAAYIACACRSSYVHCSRQIPEIRPPLLSHLRQPGRRRERPDAPGLIRDMRRSCQEFLERRQEHLGPVLGDDVAATVE